MVLLPAPRAGSKATALALPEGGVPWGALEGGGGHLFTMRLHRGLHLIGPACGLDVLRKSPLPLQIGVALGGNGGGRRLLLAASGPGVLLPWLPHLAHPPLRLALRRRQLLHDVGVIAGGAAAEARGADELWLHALRRR